MTGAVAPPIAHLQQRPEAGPTRAPAQQVLYLPIGLAGTVIGAVPQSSGGCRNVDEARGPSVLAPKSASEATSMDDRVGVPELGPRFPD